MEFGEKLKNIRVSKGLSQEELAEKTGISRRSIQNYESGKLLPKKRSAYAQLAQALGTKEALLMNSDVDFVLKADENYKGNVMRQAMDYVEGVKALWAGGEMEEEDMDEVMRALQEAYLEARRIRSKNG